MKNNYNHINAADEFNPNIEKSKVTENLWQFIRYSFTLRSSSVRNTAKCKNGGDTTWRVVRIALQSYMAYSVNKKLWAVSQWSHKSSKIDATAIQK